MYKLEREEDKTIPPRRRRTHSFSSSLLDAIYRSIDESPNVVDQEEEQEDMMIKRKQSSSGLKQVKEINNLRRAIMIESWVEKQSIQSSTLSNSASSSSESVWSSSETDSSLKRRPKPKPKPEEKKKQQQQPVMESKQPKSPNPRVFSKTKLKAMKIYGELKKVKQPISPGGRIVSFLNSIFSSGNVKKAKMCYVGAVEDVSSEHISKPVCVSASTNFSRSCLSKKPSQSSRAKNGNNGNNNNNNHNNNNNNSNNKRCVRFYPVSVILGEDSSQPYDHKCVYDDDPSLMPMSSIKTFVKSSSSLKEDPRKGKCGEREGHGKFLRSFCDNNGEADDEDEDDDDGESYSSSDLFELDHLVGIGRYREELPVYETTSLKTNQAIAKGLIL